MTRLVLVVVCLLSAVGCSDAVWTYGLPDDGPLPQGSVPNGVVLVTGPTAWQEAGQETQLTWSTSLPEGLSFDSTEVQSSEAHQTMTSAPPAVWEGAILRPGHVALGVSPAGVVVDVEVTLEPVEVVLEREGAPSCYVEVSVFEGRLEGTLALTKSKLGLVNLSPLDGAHFRGEGIEVTVSLCDEDLLEAQGAPDGPELLALDALAQRAFATLTPEIADTIPRRLGLDMAQAITLSYDDGGLGQGSHHSVVRTPFESPSPWWQLASERLVVPYSVSVTTEPHACAPHLPLPVAMSAPVPDVEAEWALLINQALLARYVHALWASGALCADRLGAKSEWPVGDWVDAWSALSALAEESSLSLRAWPEGAPDLAFSAMPDGEVSIQIDAGDWRLDLMGWRDGARVRLATLLAGVDARATLSVSVDGALSMSLSEVDVALRAAAPGLLSAPPEDVSIALVEAIVKEVVESRPLSGLLDLPEGLQPTVDLQGAYLVIRDL